MTFLLIEAAMAAVMLIVPWEAAPVAVVNRAGDLAALATSGVRCACGVLAVVGAKPDAIESRGYHQLALSHGGLEAAKT